jgi:hypothetical protein
LELIIVATPAAGKYLRDSSAKGKAVWPWSAEYDKPQPIRMCYPNVAIRGRQVRFCGVSDSGRIELLGGRSAHAA